MDEIAARLDQFTDIVWNVTSAADYRRWEHRVMAFLSSALDHATATQFKEVGVEAFMEGWQECRERQAGHLEGLALRIKSSHSPHRLTEQSAAPVRHESKKVFVVHGHDNESKESVARFLERLKLVPVILHEQPNSGRTIIEKFETFSDVGFAVVLLTPDDVGGIANNSATLSPRARQNVILELGYFMGKLSRFRVCALFKHGVEIPSDYQGVLYIELDAAGAWKKKLAQELVEANVSIDLDGLLRA